MSPTMQDPKFEMIISSESDLEEGEILEFDYGTPKGQHEDGEIPDDDYEIKHQKISGTKFKMKKKKGYADDLVKPTRLPKDNRKLKEFKVNYRTTYKSSSSDIEYIFESKKKSEINQKHSSPHNQDNLNIKSKQRHGLKNSYGTVEDIMTQIDQTLCRKSRCHYKRRKSKEKYSSDRSQRSKSPTKESKQKNKHYKYKKSSSSDSCSDSENFLSRNKKPTKICKRKREKESNKDKDVIYLCSDDSLSEDSDAPRKRNCTGKEKRDFDEYRKQLLEKLSKEKSDSKLDCENIPLPDEDELSRSSDIQEIEMMDDTNAFVDDTVSESSSTIKIINKSAESSGKSFMDAFYVTRDVSQSTSQPEASLSENEDDDTELIKLRLLALTSNRKKKDQVSDDASSHSLEFDQCLEAKSEEIDGKSEENDAKSEENSCDLKEENEADLDRNELLLRAEALKTALLKKHQKRLQKTSSDKNSNLENANVDFNSLKVENDKLNLGEEINISLKADAPEISDPPSKCNLDVKIEDNNLLGENLSDSKAGDKRKEFSSLEIARSKLPLAEKFEEMSNLEIARRKLPRALEKSDEFSKLEIARRKLPRNLEKLEKVSSLEIARRKLLKVRNALNEKNTACTSEKDVSNDSLQARLLALANETSLPPPLLQPDTNEPRQVEQNVSQDSNATTVKPSFNELLEMSEENCGPTILQLVGKPRERKLSRKQLKRLKYKERKKLERINRDEKNLSEVTVKKILSTNVEDEDEKLRVQLLNDLDKKKNLKDEDNNLNDAAQLPNSQLNKKIINESKLLNKQIGDIKNIVNNSSKAPVLPKIPKSEIQRIIIHLGPDSSDDDEYDCDKKNGSEVKEKSTDALEGNVPKVPLPIDVEKSVELLLQRARQEVEGKMGKNQNNVNATPEAVYKHLPPSQRLEYIRLKQKIAEKENLKKKTAPITSNQTPVSSAENSNNQNLSGIKSTAATTSQPAKTKNKSSPTEPSAFSQNLNSPTTPVGNKENVIVKNSKNISSDKTTSEPKKGKVIKSPIKAPSNTSPVKLVNKSPVKTLIAPNATSPVKKIFTSPLNGKKSEEEQKKEVTQNQSKISRLKLLLKNIKIEKTIEERYEKEIQKLKGQLNLLELKRKQQRLKIERLAKESKSIYASFQSNREENKEPNPSQNVPKENDKTEVEERKEEKEEKEGKEEKEEKEEKDLQPKGDESAESGKPPEEVTEAALESTGKNSDAESKPEPKDNGDSTNYNHEIQIPVMECDEKIENNPALVSVDSSSDLKEYNSPLQAITARTEDSDSKRIDPNTIMCQFDLLGKCNDEECAFQHYRTS